MRSNAPSERGGSRPQPRAARGRAAPAWTRRDRWATPQLNEHSCSLDDLVGAGEKRWRHRQAERLRGLQVDDQREFGGLLDR